MNSYFKGEIIIKEYTDVLEKILSRKTLDLLYEKSVCDSIQFIESAFTKLMYAVIEYNAINHLEEEQIGLYNEWRNELFFVGTVKKLPTVDLSYFGTKSSLDILIPKILFGFFQYLHSVYDISAQIVNTCLLANRKIRIDSVSFKRFHEKTLTSHTQYADIKSFMENISELYEFQYIDDFNNINKHQYQMDCLITTYLDRGNTELKIAAFKKNGHTYSEQDMKKAMEKSLKFTIQYIDDLMNLVTNHLLNVNYDYNQDRYQRVFIYVQVSEDHSQDGGYSYVISDKEYTIGDIIRVLYVSRTIHGGLDLKNIYDKTIFLKKSTGNYFAKAQLKDEYSEPNKIFEILEYREYSIVEIGDMHNEITIQTFVKPKILVGELENS